MRGQEGAGLAVGPRQGLGGACLSAVLTVGQAQAPSPPNWLGSTWLSLSLPPPHLHLTWRRGSRCSASWEHISP